MEVGKVIVSRSNPRVVRKSTGGPVGATRTEWRTEEGESD